MNCNGDLGDREQGPEPSDLSVRLNSLYRVGAWARRVEKSRAAERVSRIYGCFVHSSSGHAYRAWP